MADQTKFDEIFSKIEEEYNLIDSVDTESALSSLRTQISDLSDNDRMDVINNILDILLLIKNGVPNSPAKLDYLSQYASNDVMQASSLADMQNIAKLGLDHPNNWEPLIELYNINKNLLPKSLKEKIEGVAII